FHLQPLRGDVQTAAEAERPGVAFHRHLVPTVQVLKLQAAVDLYIIHRAGEFDARGDRAVNAHVASEDQAADLAEGASFQLDVDVHAVRAPAAFAGHALPVWVSGAVG